MSDNCLYKSTCDKLWPTIQSVTKQNMELETKLQIAIEALEFYGDEKMWHGAKYKNHTATLEHGYTRAKEALEKIGGV